MVQTSRFRWQIENEAGSVICGELYLASPYYAREYIEHYISSFIGWTYELIVRF